MGNNSEDFLSELADKIDEVILKNIEKQLKLPGMLNWILMYYGELLSLLMDDERTLMEPEKLTGSKDKLEGIKERLSLIIMGCMVVAKTLKVDLHNPIVETLKRIEEDC